MKPSLNYTTNDITICNNADLELISVYVCVFSRFFPNLFTFSWIIMNMQMRLFSCRTTGCKDLTYHIINDITTCNNEDFGMKSVDLWVFLRFSLMF